MTDKTDWIEEGKCEAPRDHDEAYREMTEMRESIRNLVNKTQIQNDKLRSPKILSDVEEDQEIKND